MSLRKSVAILFIILTALFSSSSYADRITNIEKLFNFAENQFPQYFSPSPVVTQTVNPWTYRYYSDTGIYIGINTEDQVYVIGGEFGDSLVYIGSLEAFINQQCSQRIGPYATQTTAWQRWQETQSQGYEVSNGVFPCYDDSFIRGYCFSTFYQC